MTDPSGELSAELEEFDEPEEVESETVPRPLALQLHDSVVFGSSGSVDFEYRVLCFKPDPSLGLFPQPIILVASVENKFLVAVPAASWSRTTRDRFLPSQALSKVFSAQVLAASEEHRDQPSDGVCIKVWFGLLRSDFEQCISLDEASLPLPAFPTVQSDVGYLPYAQSLVSVSDEKFAFLSAESGQPPNPQHPKHPKELEARVTQMETHLGEILSSLKTLTQAQGTPTVPDPLPAEKTVPPSRPSALKSPKFPGLDQSVVNAALQAGIDHSQLNELSKMIGSKKPLLRDSPMDRPTPRVKFDVLGEPIEVDQAESGVPELPSGASHQDPVSAALVKLTSIVDTLSQKRRSTTSLADLSDDYSVLMDPGASSSSSGGRRHSAVLSALRKALHDHPEEIFSVIEARMEKDVGSQEICPGVGGPSATFRGWSEHRSRVPNISTSVRVMWAICGALDCLRGGRIPEAKCRLALLIGQLDQLAIDQGQWVLSAEGSLEDAPPFASFSRHTLPDHLEPQHAKLWPTPWAEAMMWAVKERDEFLERKNKIGKRGGQQKQQDDDPPPGGSAKGKKGKGKGKTTNSTASAPAEEKISS